MGTHPNLSSVRIRSLHFRCLALLVVAGLPAAGANSFPTSSVLPSEVLHNLEAPAAPEHPWSPPDLGGFASVLKLKAEPAADTQLEYDLPALIDLAESSNPETKVAWDHAKAAAAAAGLAQSEYYPVLALRASGEYARAPVPLPLTPNAGGFMDVREQTFEPVAELEWVLLDFGRRQSGVAAAKNRLLAANLGFNAQQEAIVFQVQGAFYELTKVRGRIDVAQSSLASAMKVQEAAETRFRNGLTTAPDVSLARQQAVQAAFELEEVQAKERDAEVVLADRIGITPTVPLRVVDFSKLAIPTNLEDTVEQFIDRSLAQRPDLLAKVAILREKEAEVRRAGTAYYPTLAFQGEGGGAFERSRLDVGGNSLPIDYTRQPTWGVGLALTWPLFDGSRKHKVELAKAERAAAEQDLNDARNQAVSQVWQTYTDTKLAIRRLDVAVALVAASEKSYQQTFESYQNGLSSLVDVLTARRELSQAHYAQLDTRATLLESTAALAFASGDLGPQLLKRTYRDTHTAP